MQLHSTYRRRRAHNQGFTLLEILVVVVLLGALISSGIYFIDIGQKRKGIDLLAVQVSTLKSFPTALLQVYQTKLTWVGLTAANLTATNEVVAGSPVAWAINGTPRRNTAAIIFTMANRTEAADLKTFLEDNEDTTLISDVRIDTDDKKVIVTYSI